MPNKLYISDLDGTLLNKDAELSKFTYEGLNRLIKNGVKFSVATARTSSTVVKMLEGINIEIPIILMNGVCSYDLKANKYTHIFSIGQQAKQRLIETIDKGFLYCIDNDEQITYFENTNSPNSKEFMEERIKKYNKVFEKVDSFAQCLHKNVVYYSVSDLEENLRALAEKLRQIEGLHVEFYRDIYNENYWYLEVCSSEASKYNAVMKLKETYDFDTVIGFGDNLNDLSMFEACDMAFAVENAKEEVKKRADGVIGANVNDGVVLKIAELEGIK